MIDIEQIRQNPEAFQRAIANKGIPLKLELLLAADDKRRAIGKEVNRLREQRNRITELVVAEPQNRDLHIAQSRIVGNELAEKATELQKIESEYERLMAFVPSLPCDGVPIGLTDKDNIEISRFGTPAKKTFKEKDHIELAAMHGMVDFEGARNIAGSRAYALIGMGALLEMAVMRFTLDHLLAKDFTLVQAPLLVKDLAMFGTGYFPLGEDNAYELEKDKLYLTGTSEVGLVSMHTKRTYDLADLPMRFVGISPCFRREAGAAGRDTKGLYRVHQFQKIEQVVFCANDPAISEQEHYLLLQNSEEILQALELPYRIAAACTGELGLGQVRKHDVETWMPSREAYCETHSCSSFHDFQARRLGIRYRDEKQKAFVHSLNNTAIASPRILIPLLENHQNADGSIYIPAALRQYLGGREILEPG